MHIKLTTLKDVSDNGIYFSCAVCQYMLVSDMLQAYMLNSDSFAWSTLGQWTIVATFGWIADRISANAALCLVYELQSRT